MPAHLMYLLDAFLSIVRSHLDFHHGLPGTVFLEPSLAYFF
jgi:hypothetical protein